jgi:hypothetical protein
MKQMELDVLKEPELFNERSLLIRRSKEIGITHYVDRYDAFLRSVCGATDHIRLELQYY